MRWMIGGEKMGKVEVEERNEIKRYVWVKEGLGKL